MATMMSAQSDDVSYGISAVSRLTGIPLDTLRAWERRYAVVEPRRAESNRRAYTRHDVVRLQLIKQLVDRGCAISTVAELDEPALRERLRLYQDPATPIAHVERPARVLIYGDALPFLVDRWRGELGPLEILGSHVRYDAFQQQALAQQPEVLVLEWPALEPDMAARVRELRAQVGAERVVVVYAFASERDLARLRQERVVALRAPVTARMLREACRLELAPGSSIEMPDVASITELDEQIPVRRFDSKTLAAVANLPTGIRCECPHHLADLLFRLTAFERYSADCENRNPRDAALHAHLHRAAAQARALLEAGLAHLIQCEEIDLSVYS